MGWIGQKIPKLLIEWRVNGADISIKKQIQIRIKVANKIAAHL